MSEQPQPDPDGVNLTIDGHAVRVPKGTLVVEAAKQVGIEIPVFCYHHRLDPVGACRMCLVEIAPGPPKAQAACTTPVAEGMTVKVTSPMATRARADVLEYELANHPLDCPVCDKGGECPLQDYTFRHGYPTSRQSLPRLHFAKPLPLSNSIALDRERCVLCYRCTRYYDEIAWEQELTSTQRGVHTYIATQFDEPLKSIYSGNIIDLCPVGALTSRVWRFQSRPWDMDHAPGVCSKCAVGCNVNLWQRRGELMRITSRENPAIDDGWICDRGRFDYTDVNDATRLTVPTGRNGDLSWTEAIRATAGVLGNGGDQLGIHLARNTTTEELFLLSRLLEGPLRGARVVMENASQLPTPAAHELSIAEIEQLGTIVVVATDVRDEAPIVNLRIKKAVRKGARLIVVHHSEVDFHRHPDVVRVDHAEGAAATTLAGPDLSRLLAESRGPVGIIHGDGRGTEDVAGLVSAVDALAARHSAGVMRLYRATNERGARELGLALSPSLGAVRRLFCWRAAPAEIPPTVEQIAFADMLPRERHVTAVAVLPAISFAEDEGSYCSLEGRVQFLQPPLTVSLPRRHGWDVLEELSRVLGVDVDHLGVGEIQREIAAAFPRLAALNQAPDPGAIAAPVLHGAARP